MWFRQHSQSEKLIKYVRPASPNNHNIYSHIPTHTHASSPPYHPTTPPPATYHTLHSILLLDNNQDRRCTSVPCVFAPSNSCNERDAFPPWTPRHPDLASVEVAGLLFYQAIFQIIHDLFPLEGEFVRGNIVSPSAFSVRALDCNIPVLCFILTHSVAIQLDQLLRTVFARLQFISSSYIVTDTVYPSYLMRSTTLTLSSLRYVCSRRRQHTQ